LSILVKRKPNGEISRFLQDHVSVGDVLRVVPPAGRFTFAPAAPPAPGAPPPPRDIGVIAAGSGIAPILPLIRQALREEPQSHVWLIDQNHSEADIIFAEELRALQTRITRISLLSAPQTHNILPRRLNNANLEQYVRELTRFDPSASVFFCCGPEALMRMAKFTLRVMGFEEAQFRQEHFTIDPPPRAALPVDPATRKITLSLGTRRYEFPVTFPTNILQAALDHHAPLPYSCRGGRCSACSVRCTEGKVLMSLNEVLTDQDIKEGWVLTCTGYALTDLTLEA
jgi:ring-1,2-phenylacetyl-CoA epoxidase subunit PaaE